jgi:hypothetical protein
VVYIGSGVGAYFVRFESARWSNWTFRMSPVWPQCFVRAASSTVVRNGWSKHFPGFRRAPSNPSPQVPGSQVGRKLLELPLPIMSYVGKEERNETCQLECMCHRSWTPGQVYGVHNGKGAQVIISLDSLKRTIESHDSNWRGERGWSRLTGNVLNCGACIEDRHHIPEIYQS